MLHYYGNLCKQIALVFTEPLILLAFSLFIRRTSHLGGCIFGSRQPSLRKDRACPRYRVAPLARQSLTRFENIKSLSSCFKRGRRIARIGTQREANALCVSSAKCRLFEISYVSLDDCFAAMQIVMVTKRLLRPIFISISSIFFLSLSGY